MAEHRKRKVQDSAVWGAGEVQGLLKSWRRQLFSGRPALGYTHSRIWLLLEYLKLPGIAATNALAIQIFSLYILAEATDGGSGKCVKKKIAQKLLPILLSCVQLASKVSSIESPITTGCIISILSRYGIRYSVKSVIEMEFHVFKTINFRIPTFTIFDHVDLLIETCAFTAGLDTKDLSHVTERLLKFSLLIHDKIVLRYKWAIGDEKLLISDTLLAASVMLSACRLTKERSVSTLANLLAEQINEPARNITCLANIITTFALE